MRKFNIIKKSRKKSEDIDEKIEYLNKECQKTGLREGMVTSKIYQGSTKVPNQEYSAFQALDVNGYGLALSGADGNSIGGASVGVNYLGVDGVALSPPHPVTGVRHQALHVRDGLGGTEPLRPGAVIKRGFADNAPDYTMGSAMWFYFPTHDNGEGVPPGKWCNFEYGNFENNSGWGFWDTVKTGQFAGLHIFNRTTSQHPCGDIDLATKIASINFGENGTIGAPQTTVLTQKDLGDPGHLPINLKDFSKQAFDYLKGKAEGVKNIAIDAIENIKDFFGKLGDAINNFDGTPIESDTEDKATNLYDGIKDGMNLLNDAKDIIKNSPKDENGDIEAGAVGSIENPHQNSVSDTTAETILQGIDLSTKPEILSDIIGVYIQNNVSAAPGLIGGRGSMGAKGTHNNLPGLGKQDGGYPAPFINENGDIVIPDTYAFRAHGHENRWLPKATGALIDTLNAHTNFYVSDNAKQDALDWAATVMDQSVGVVLGAPGNNDPIVHFQTVITKEQVDRIIAKQSKNNQNESYISESVKLGHFDPEVLNVDINDIRKGIMPEFPKDPPPEMINGYSAKSKLAPKKVELPPFIKVTKKDLAQNHKLTDKEIQDFLDDVNKINEYIKNNPADLKYAMIRYPKHDPRLAQLNWQMDQMKAASKEYMETHFPENEKLFKKIQNKIRQNIEMTNPKNFTGHKEAPKFTDDNIEMSEQRKQIALKHFKKPVKIKKLFKR